jgi:hypothetical protein
MKVGLVISRRLGVEGVSEFCSAGLGSRASGRSWGLERERSVAVPQDGCPTIDRIPANELVGFIQAAGDEE